MLSETGHLYFAVLEVRDCVSMDAISLNDLFVTLSLGGADSRTTVKNECGSEAIFSEAFQLYDSCFIGFYFYVLITNLIAQVRFVI